jgi:hypothetical protein
MISPTLAEFLNVPYFTKMSEEDIIVSIWHYITENRLLLDDRLIMLDQKLNAVIHPEACWENEECHMESAIIMIFIAKMHLDPRFIEKDVQWRLKKLRQKRAARVLLKFMKRKKYGDGGEECGDDGHVESSRVQWLNFLVDKYGHPKSGTESRTVYDADAYNGGKFYE